MAADAAVELSLVVASHAMAKIQTQQGIRPVQGKIVVDLEDESGNVTRLILGSEEAAKLPIGRQVRLTVALQDEEAGPGILSLPAPTPRKVR